MFHIIAALVLLLLAASSPARADHVRPELKCTTIQPYHFETGIDVSTRLLDDLRYLNVSMLRIEFITNAQGNIPYREYGYIVDELAERGIEVLGLIAYQSLPHSGPSDWATDSFRERYVARTRQIVNHYANRQNSIQAWEIWNEQDLAVPEFYVRIDPEPYAQLLIESYDAIKEIDSGATVLHGGISPKGLRTGQNYLRKIYEEPAIQDYRTERGHYPFDVVAVHPYQEEYSRIDSQFHFSLRDFMNQRVKSIMNEFGDRHKKVWITELGWNSAHNSDAVQANRLEESFRLMDELTDPAHPDDPPYVERYFWFKYDEWAPTERWGLITRNRAQQKPSYARFRDLTPTVGEPVPPLDPGPDAPVWGATSDADLPVQVGSDNLLRGKQGVIVSGALHNFSTDTSRLTNGQFDEDTWATRLGDSQPVPLRLRYSFDEPVDIQELRVFAGHGPDGPHRAFQNHDVYVNGSLAVYGLTTGPFGQSAPVSGPAASVVRWLPEEGESLVAEAVTQLDIVMHPVSANTLEFRDQWSPVDHPTADTDGAGRAFRAPVIKEIEVLGFPTAPPPSDGWLLH